MIRKSRFKIHLSTAIVLMFVAGGIMRANFGSQREIPDTRSNGVRTHESYVYVRYGWPIVAQNALVEIVNPLDGELGLVDRDEFTDRTIHFSAAVWDAIVAIVILLVVWFVSEWRIRRHNSLAPKS